MHDDAASQESKSAELIPHLFRTEWRKMTSVLCRRFGIAQLDLAEDIVSEVFLSALESWSYNGLPPNPTAWLYAVAKNKALNRVRRDRIFHDRVQPFVEELKNEETSFDVDFSPIHAENSQLRMLFVICDPALPLLSQQSLALRVLCGFGLDEISTALLCSVEAASKRLLRAKELLRQQQPDLEFSIEEAVHSRLEAVLSSLYLLFSEGYHSDTHERVIREELCGEAMRLCSLLLAHPLCNQASTKALYALMCFQASRFAARQSSDGEIILYDQQDRSTWDAHLISEGARLLHEARGGEVLSRYHIEAAIAFQYTQAEDNAEKWQNVLSLYDLLLQQHPSIIAATNRCYALSKVKGTATAYQVLTQLPGEEDLYYQLLCADLCAEDNAQQRKSHLEKALQLCKREKDKLRIQARLQ